MVPPAVKRTASGRTPDGRTYANPVIPGFYPDPSVCRVGADFYAASSSFQWFPGVPLHHSRDLEHWRLLGHALTRISQLPLSGARSSEGIFAPTLRFHDGTFYLITTNATQGGNFWVTAPHPEGPWSDPVWLEFPGIDPSLFFDQDGRVYLQGAGYGDGILQSEVDPRTGRLAGKSRRIWPGTGGRYPEGPHLYRRGDVYYLLIAEGGTEYGHMVTIARSKSPWGPFESCPRNPILTHRDAGGHPWQGVGHGDLFDDAQGRWWLLVHGFRAVGGHFHHLGRETLLAPVAWDRDGWPVVNQNRLLESAMRAPLPAASPWPAPNERDDFTEARLGPEWSMLRQPVPGAWSLNERPGFLRLYGLAESLDQHASPALVARRQQHLDVEAAARLEFQPARAQDEAGLTVFMDERHHAEICVRKKNDGRVALVRQRIGDVEGILGSRPLPNTGAVRLGVSARGPRYVFAAAPGDDEPLVELGACDARYVSSEVAGGFTGVFLGLYATGHGNRISHPADFDWFAYRPAPQSDRNMDDRHLAIG